jgi:hypothetical protein
MRTAETILNIIQDRGKRKLPHSTELCGGASPAFVIFLQLCSFIPIVDHPLQRLPDLRVIHAKHCSPDPRKPDHHR